MIQEKRNIQYLLKNILIHYIQHKRWNIKMLLSAILYLFYAGLLFSLCLDKLNLSRDEIYIVMLCSTMFIISIYALTMTCCNGKYEDFYLHSDNGSEEIKRHVRIDNAQECREYLEYLRYNRKYDMTMYITFAMFAMTLEYIVFIIFNISYNYNIGMTTVLITTFSTFIGVIILRNLVKCYYMNHNENMV